MFIFFATNKEDYTKIVGNIIFSKYNSLGWYGIFISIMLIFLDIFCFTSPTSKEFTKLKSKNKNLENHISEGRKTQFLNDDNDDILFCYNNINSNENDGTKCLIIYKNIFINYILNVSHYTCVLFFFS